MFYYSFNKKNNYLKIYSYNTINVKINTVFIVNKAVSKQGLTHK